MGEYAIRASDNEEVKIGTCESMYFVRYEDRDKLKQAKGSSINPQNEINLFWRLPYPDEDHIEIGEYKNSRRGQRLYYMEGKDQHRHVVDFCDPETIEDPGTIQLYHQDSGLLASIKCYHGEKLPVASSDVKFFWNGKGHAFELVFVKNTKEGVLPVVHCRHCNHMWRYTWDEILPYIDNAELKKRLSKHNI